MRRRVKTTQITTKNCVRLDAAGEVHDLDRIWPVDHHGSSCSTTGGRENAKIAPKKKFEKLK